MSIINNKYKLNNKLNKLNINNIILKFFFISSLLKF